MAVINPYAGDVIQFPAGTPASVINNYYAAYLRNQQINAAQTPWYEQAFHGVTNDVLNPFLGKIASIPFEDYRQEFNTGQNIRQDTAKQNLQYENLIKELQWKEDQASREADQLGTAVGNYGAIANQIGPSSSAETTLSGGGVPPYGPYDDPWSTQLYVPSDQQERRPTSTDYGTDEMGRNIVDERGPENLTPPEPTNQGSVFSTIPGKRPSTAEALATFAAKYPDQAGRLVKFLGQNNTYSMIEPNKQADLESKIAAQDALAKLRTGQTEERSRLLDEREAALRAKTGLTEAQTNRVNIDASRIEALAQTEQGRAALQRYLMDNATTLDEETFQRISAVLQRAQLRETPTQQAGRTKTNAEIMANKPSPSTQLDDETLLAAKEAAGTITPAEQIRLNTLRENRRVNPQPNEKSGNPIDFMMWEAINKQRAAKGLPPIDPRTGQPIDTQYGRGGMPQHTTPQSQTPSKYNSILRK